MGDTTTNRELPLREKETGPDSTTKPRELEYGRPVLKHFLFDPLFRNFNHGSFGSYPREIRTKLREYQDRAEAAPDPFIRYEYPNLLDESRQAIADLLRVPVDTAVFVPNATTAANTVLRNIAWNEDGKDEILYFQTIYGAVGKTVDFITDTNLGHVSQRSIPITYPCEDDFILNKFRESVKASGNEGKRPKLCLFDTVSSIPAMRFPFEAMTQLCKEFGIITVIDGAQGVGMIDIDIKAIDPDYFFTNCHKWLHVPRGCAVLYVPLRNQPVISSTLPTSHGYVPKTGTRFNPLPPSKKSAFVTNFEFVGTFDGSPYLCVKDSIQWRKEALGGEQKINEYLLQLATEGGRKVAEILGTEVMDNSTGTASNCGMVNVRLPLWIVEDGQQSKDGIPVAPDEAFGVTQWMLTTLMHEYKTFVVCYTYNNCWWARLSAQVYLDMDDFEWAGKTLLELCQRVERKEYMPAS